MLGRAECVRIESVSLVTRFQTLTLLQKWVCVVDVYLRSGALLPPIVDTLKLLAFVYKHGRPRDGYGGRATVCFILSYPHLYTNSQRHIWRTRVLRNHQFLYRMKYGIPYKRVQDGLIVGCAQIVALLNEDISRCQPLAKTLCEIEDLSKAPVKGYEGLSNQRPLLIQAR